MNIELGTVVMSGAASTALAACILWFGRTWITAHVKTAIQHEYNLLLEQKKNELQASSAIALERAKSELAAVAEQRRIQFEAIFEKREGLLAELHRELMVAVDQAQEAVSPSRRGNIQAATQALNVLHGRMEALAIYFPEAFCRRWHECVGALSQSLTQYAMASNSQTANFEADRQLLARAVNAHVEALREIRTQLRSEIRRLLGIEVPSGSAMAANKS